MSYSEVYVSLIYIVNNDVQMNHWAKQENKKISSGRHIAFIVVGKLKLVTLNVKGIDFYLVIFQLLFIVLFGCLVVCFCFCFCLIFDFFFFAILLGLFWFLFVLFFPLLLLKTFLWKVVISVASTALNYSSIQMFERLLVKLVWPGWNWFTGLL